MNTEHKKIVIDQMGREVVLPVASLRIVSLVPSQTELLFYLGLDEEVVGITKFCIHPEEQFRKKPRIGGTKNIRLEAIHALKPNLIIGNKEENDRVQVNELAKHYPVWMSDIKTFSDALHRITRIGTVIGKMEEANALVLKLFEQKQSFLKKVIGLPKLTAAYFIWRKPWMIAGIDTFIDDLLKIAGFENVFANSTRYPTFSEEELKQVEPQIVLLSSEPYPFKEKHMAELQSIWPNAKVFLIDGELFSWYGSRLLHTFNYFKKLRKQL